MSTLDFAVTIPTPGPVSLELQNAWSSGLIAAAATKIKARWDRIVGTSELWTKNVATASNDSWKPFPNPAYVTKRGRSRDMLVGIQIRKLNLAFPKAKQAHDDMFANSAANFDLAVGAKAQNWTQHVGNTLAVTGNRLSGVRGPGPTIARVATGDATYKRDSTATPGGVFDPTQLGTPEVAYLRPETRNYFRAAVEGMLTQYVNLLLDGIITVTDGMNQNLDFLLKGYLSDPGSVPPTSFLHLSLGPPITVTLHLENGGLTAYPSIP